MAEHLNVLQRAKELFVKADAEDRIRKALVAKIDCNKTSYQSGDQVWYYRGKGWKGLA